MKRRNIFERLADTNPDLEVWWDSSPLVYRGWAQETVDSFPPEDRDGLRSQFRRMFDPDSTAGTMFRGVTTNPPLSLQAIEAAPDYWGEVVDGMIAAEPGIDKETLFWNTYKEIVRRGSEMFMPVFENSAYKYGYLSGQVDPRDVFDYDTMLAQALEIAAINPNVMIKVPGSKEGYRLIRELTSRGISTNNTLSFVLPQFKAAADAAREGLEKAKSDNVDLSRWRAVITHMTARMGHLGDLESQAEAGGIILDESDIRWAEIAVFKKAYRMLEDRGYPSKMLICSMKLGPTIDGVKRLWHLEKLAGGKIVFTCPPTFIAAAMKECDDLPLDSGIDEEPPGEVLEKLLAIPYFEEAYSEDGLTHEEFNTHTALVNTANQMQAATEKMVDFVGARLEVYGGK